MHVVLLQVVGVLSGNNTILCEEKNKYECTVGYNLKRFQGMPTNLYPNEGPRFSPFRITYQFRIWPIPS